MNYATLLSIAIVVLLLASALSLLWCWKKYAHLQREYKMLAQNTRAMSERYTKLQQSVEQNHSFSVKLGEIEEAAARIQLSRSSYHARAASATLPERYQYISSLTDNGAGAAEIAKLFSISRQEAEQLVALANLNRTP